MKTIILSAFLLFCHFAISQDTLVHTETINGSKVIVKEIFHSYFVSHDLPRAISIVLAIAATFVFVFYKPKKKEKDERETT